MIRTLYLLVGVLLFLSQVQAGEIRGKISDQRTGKPVTGAYVYLEGTQYFTNSDDNGEFSLSVPAGTYLLKVWMLSYQEYQQTVQVNDDQTVTLTVNLAEAPLSADEIVVTSTPDQLVPQASIYRERFENETISDVGEFLRNQPGFTALRKGGFAIDPVFRGFLYEQLNVQYDNGVRASNACPNRMDPPSAHLQAEELEKIEVIKGPFVVRYGPVMGGLVNLVTRRPEESQGLLHVVAETGYESNGSGKRASVALQGAQERWDYYVGYTRKSYDDYQDGSGTVVPSSFDIADYAIKLGVRPTINQRLQVSYHLSQEKDVKFPGLPMDSKEVDNHQLAVDYQWRNMARWLPALNVKVYRTYNYHLMTNEGRKNYMMTHATTPVYSETRGGRLELKLVPRSGQVLYLGGDYYWLHKWGERERVVLRNGCTGMVLDPPKTFYDKVWQDSRQMDAGIFAEWRWLASPRWTVIAGVRNDFVTSTIGDPAIQFVQLYGNADTFTSSNFSATATIRYEGWKNTVVNLSVGRGMRSPNLTEMFINHMTVGMDPFEYVGNPYLDSEINNQVELGVMTRVGEHRLQGNVYASYLQNYISAAIDSGIARLYMPCMDPKVAKRFVNLDAAYKYGFEVYVKGPLAKGFAYSLGAAYTYGQNLDADEPLPFIPPLEGIVGLRYQSADGRFWSEVTTRMVGEKTRYAASVGEGPAPGFTVVNFMAGWQVHRYVQIYGGVYNLFNRQYFEYLNRPYTNMLVTGRLTEPGRSFVLNVRFTL